MGRRLLRFGATLDPGREFFGWIAGLGMLPILLAVRQPSCPTFETCEGEPRIVWPYFVASAVMIGFGLVTATLSTQDEAKGVTTP